MSHESPAPEAASAPETPSSGRAHKVTEIIAGVVLGIAALLTAYAAYQASQTDGTALEGYTQSARTTADANGWFNEAVARYANDQSLFLEWALQIEEGNTDTADAIRQTLFTPELETATAAWEQTGDDGPPTPLAMEEYVLPAQAEGERLTVQAAEEFEAAQQADQAGDKFGLATVFLAVSLFLGGVANLFSSLAVRVTVLVFAAVFLVPGAVMILEGRAAI